MPFAPAERVDIDPAEHGWGWRAVTPCARRPHSSSYSLLPTLSTHQLAWVPKEQSVDAFGLGADRLRCRPTLRGQQVQRVDRQLLRRQVKTETSEAPLPLIDLCIAALKLRKEQQDADRERAGNAWIETGLVFTTWHGTPIEPRNFSRSFDRSIVQAGVPRITVHGTRKTCGSLLAALDVHPRVAMQILRHSKIAVTMEIYTEVPSSATRDALKRLGQWLGS